MRFILFLLLISFSLLQSQTVEVDSIIWQGKQVKMAKGEFTFKLKNVNDKFSITTLLESYTKLSLKKQIDKFGIGLLKFEDRKSIEKTIDELKKRVV